mgnify:FL=1
MIDRKFQSEFGSSPDYKVFAPSRINLIGEHTDYCGGECMPFATSNGTDFFFSSNDSGTLEVYTERFKERHAFALKLSKTRRMSLDWKDYVYGVLFAISDEHKVKGGQIFVRQSIGSAGLASSASFCVGLAKTLCPELSPFDLAKRSWQAERSYVGVKCGIMDQISISLGGGLNLKAKDLSFSSVSLDNSDCQLVILDTLVPRELLSSNYNNRYEEMLEVAEAIGLTRVDSLAGVDRVPQNLRPKLKARLRHVLTECERVKRAAKAIEMREWRVLGFLMNQSHASLRDDYEVSCPELDTIVSLAQAQKGVLGARLTGGGFGGCAIALCQKNSAQSWQKVVEEAYREVFGYNPNIFEANFSQGVKLTRFSSESK